MHAPSRVLVPRTYPFHDHIKHIAIVTVEQIPPTLHQYPILTDATQAHLKAETSQSPPATPGSSASPVSAPSKEPQRVVH
jgi:hypothetical protein